MEQARVAMKGTGSWVGSDAHGLFRVQLLRSNRIGQSIEVEVEGVPGWLLYQPADGRVVVPEQPQTVALKLLPKGSLRFLGSQGLASLLARMISEAKESARDSPAVPLGSMPPPVDLKGPMQRWASEYGLSLAQVQTAVDKWAKEVLSRKAAGRRAGVFDKAVLRSVAAAGAIIPLARAGACFRSSRPAFPVPASIA